MSRPPRLVCLGNFTVDEVVLPDGRVIADCIGGDAFYAALAARLTLPEVEMAAPVGTDLPRAVADAVTARFSAAALPARPLPTLRNRITYAADGRRVWTPFFSDEAFDTLSPLPEDLPAAYLAADAFLVLAMTLDAQERLVSFLRSDTNALVALDLQEDYIAGNEARLRAMIARTDVFLPSADEVRQLVGTNDWAAAAHTFAALGPSIVVIKLGPAGVLVHHRESGETFDVSALTDAPVDTTGAGDAFCGGFMASLVQMPGNLRLAARRGTIAASFAIGGYGAAGILSATRAAAARLAASRHPRRRPPATAPL